MINTQLYLVKNGTVTEGCIPYTSIEGKLEKCSNKCKGEETFKKYYSKNAYKISDYDEDDYYDIVTIMLDQLINFGPFVAHIDTYEDFNALYKKDCKDVIYRHNYDKNEKPGSHAVVVVGYGYQDSKYYWIIQNSWGTEFCGDGFLKVEFGQINIETFAFSEPYIQNNSTEKKEIEINLNLKDNCEFDFYTNINDKDEDYFEMNFKGIDTPEDNIYYQCSFLSTINNNQGKCIYRMNFWNNLKGNFKYNGYISLKKNNTFKLNFQNIRQMNILNRTYAQFLYYGYDYIDAVYDPDIYITENTSSILLISYNKTPDKSLVSNIYSNTNSKEPLICDYINYEYQNKSLIACEISKNEYNFFKNEKNELPLIYDVLCGLTEEMLATVHILDKTKYPIFIIKK